MRSGITRRWLRGSLLITVLLVLLVEVMFLYSATRSYYNGVQQTMYRRFSSITGQLKMYTGETSQKTAASRSVALRRMVEQFSDKDKYEFMLLDSYGGVIASSSGTDAEGIVTHTDFEQAQDAVDGQGIAIYRTQSGEMVMAACCLVPYAAEDVAAMRIVTSLTLVEEQLKRTVVVALIMGAAVLAFTIMSGLYFVRSIVVPLGQVERTAAGIARGELDVRLPVTGDERDEVDRLRGTINRMAEGLEETEKMKNEFISSVSHELRTPLTSIRGWVETLRTLDDPSDENYRKGLEIINNETARLYNMVEELLDFSRLQNGRLKMTCRPLDLVAELTDAVLFCEARIQREGLVLVYNEPEEMIPVYADPDRLRQVFINILDNAIKYSAPGGRITVKLWAGEYKAFIELIDQGRGIPPEDLENVKTKFYKGSNSVRGSGIGLALVDSIMTALDGTMDIKSTLGRGTVVTLGLPLYKNKILSHLCGKIEAKKRTGEIHFMNHEPKKECFKTSVGGQALMEGIMMRGPEHICCAVRKPDGTIETKIDDTPKHGIWAKIPLVRGAIAMIESLITGYHYMMYSAQVSMGDEYDTEEEESAFEKWVGDHLGKKAEDILMAGAALVGGLFAILLFTVLPTVLVGGLGKVVTLTRWPRVILEAVLKVAIFLSYMVAISKMKEIHRVFEYHGAEHKTIACYEAGDELTVENVRKYTRFHPRCGTSFLILVVIVSVFLYSVLPWSSTSLRVLFKLLLLPVVMGISYELLKWCGRSDNIATRIIRQPGLWVQRLTVFEPDDSMIEVAIAAVTPVLPEDPEDGKW